jgi:hypothetical protein
VSLIASGEGDLDLEIWAAERAADAFAQVYGTALSIQRGSD